AFVWALTSACLLLESATSGTAWMGVECDQLSSPYILAFCAASAGVAMMGMASVFSDWRTRAAAGAVLAGVAAARVFFRAPQCMAGPFAALEPLTRSLWLDNVAESLPLWRRGLGVLIANGGFAVLGVVGAAWAMRSTEEKTVRLRWASVLVLCVAAGALM